MKAAVLTGYDKNGRNLELRDVPMPEMKENDVLVKIRTAGVNPLDNMIIRDEVRMIVPYRFPLVLGNEFVGVIEQVNKHISAAAMFAGDCL
jgi:NADPH:quinone reductase-like Zn-dependent oxidoreductase